MHNKCTYDVCKINVFITNSCKNVWITNTCTVSVHIKMHVQQMFI